MFALLFLCVFALGQESLYDFTVESIDGTEFPLHSLRGSVSLVVNVASLCGFTESGYTSMSRLWDEYGNGKFHILAFPSNEFGRQEPWTEPEIQRFTKEKYDVSFPVLQKVQVNGPHTHPVFQFLKQYFPGDVSWNFHGIWLVDGDGVPMRRYNAPNWEVIERDIKNALKSVE